MNICILGWYGTETLGDRAILDGIIYIFAAIQTNIRISIGSLHPIVTKRTIFEDNALYHSHSNNIEVNSFDVQNKNELHNTIKWADIVIMGGGPLMDLDELYIIQHSFKYAKKINKPTALIGCGYGPLNKKEYINCVKKIISFSDLIIMRSDVCRNRILQLSSENDKKKIYASMDPAIISAIEYRRLYRISNYYDNHENGDDEWLMNIRDLDYVYAKKNFYYPKIKMLVSNISTQVKTLCLMPMHTFSVGSDDRYIQNRIKQELNIENLHVIQKPLSLKECYEKIISVKGCIGMRYHSIVFQTFLNGNNYLCDYTDFTEGKINAFLHSIQTENFYSDRYINILRDCTCNLKIKKDHTCFTYNDSQEQVSIQLYIEQIKKLIRAHNAL